MKNIAEELLKVITEYKIKFQELNEDEWNYQSAPGKWTRREILGHIIDSAANNHQRFVRAQIEENVQITYEQDAWVKYQNYKLEKSEILVELWYYYNMHLIHVIKNIPAENYSRKVDVKKEDKVTLKWLGEDYLRHLKHHLNQIGA